MRKSSNSAIVPWYVPAAPPHIQPAQALRVLLANVTVDNRNYAALIDLIRDEKPDVMAIVKTNQD